jgi:hypothetical protein
VWPKLRAESVIELPAHTIFRSRTEVGDQLIIERYEAKRTVIPKSNLAAMQVSRGDQTILEGVAHAE